MIINEDKNKGEINNDNNDDDWFENRNQDSQCINKSPKNTEVIRSSLRTFSTEAGVSGAPLGSSPKGAGVSGPPLESSPMKIGVSGALLGSSNDLEKDDVKMADDELLDKYEKLRIENEQMKLQILEFQRSISLPLPDPLPISTSKSIPTTTRIGQIIGNAVPENEDEEAPINTSNSIRKRKYAKSPPNSTLPVSLNSKKQNNDNVNIGNYDPFDFHDSHSNDEIIDNEEKKSDINSNLLVPSLSPPNPTSSTKLINGKNRKSPSKSPISKSPILKSSKQFDSKLGKKSPISSQITSQSKSPISTQNGIKANMKISPKKKNENTEEIGVRVQKEVENKVEKRKKEEVKKVFICVFMCLYVHIYFLYVHIYFPTLEMIPTPKCEISVFREHGLTSLF
jgi:hypothetical protein